ncbi:hypothetical protein [Alkalicoccus halolimnae]|uniref:Uncharacterized protein n=1 Tax=Alkalicoccus halolimnae TaxID=1667239 RepID=A0A5C7F5Q6_9BACI|nr:hypothetical protein [Alkalicoccus halolimnae]TXF84015.1 hypothetical protein FTX54_12075 [Alkalicoccus halolimnae]
MPRNKLIILGAGALILIILSILLFVMDSEEQVIQTEDIDNTEASETSPETDETAGADPASGSDSSIDIEGSEEDLMENVEADTEEEYRESTREALEEFTPDENDSFSREAFEDHALLFTLYQQETEESVVEEGESASAAEYVAIEMNGWKNFAEENYDFTYDQSEFMQFAEEEQSQALDQDAEVRIFIDELEQEDPELSRQQLEFQFALSYIWHSIQDEAAEEYDVNPQSTTEWNQLYFEIEQRVFNYISEENPEFIEGESN